MLYSVNTMEPGLLLKILILTLTATALAQQTPSLDKEDVFWLSVKDKGVPSLLEEYLERFPRGTYVKIACHDLGQLRGTAALPAVCASPTAPPAAAAAPTLAASPAPAASVVSPAIPSRMGAME